MAWRGALEEDEAARGVTFTFDTGMLIALERRKHHATEAFQAIVRRNFLPIVPTVVYAEWWRKHSDIREEILAAIIVEDIPPLLYRTASEALGAIRGSTLTDAVIMASTALRGGGVVYTSDIDDLTRLTHHFPTVLVLPV